MNILTEMCLTEMGHQHKIIAHDHIDHTYIYTYIHQYVCVSITKWLHHAWNSDQDNPVNYRTAKEFDLFDIFICVSPFPDLITTWKDLKCCLSSILQHNLAVGSLDRNFWDHVCVWHNIHLLKNVVDHIVRNLSLWNPNEIITHNTRFSDQITRRW